MQNPGIARFAQDSFGCPGHTVVHSSPMTHPRPEAARDGYPARIICLTEETTETLYLLGAGDLVVGVSGFTVRPAEARSKPKVSEYISANYDLILELEPDVVFAFSDLQADIAAELIRRGVPVYCFNQRSIEQILTSIRIMGSIVGYHREAAALTDRLQTLLDSAKTKAAALPRRPRVFFEEWHDPLISGIRWVSELVALAGGDDIFPQLVMEQSATKRIVKPEHVVEENPELILASWCGRKVHMDTIRERPGFAEVAAVRNGHIYEIESSLILQPGPACILEGLRCIQPYIESAATSETAAS